jgi:hypothetical protein
MMRMHRAPGIYATAKRMVLSPAEDACIPRPALDGVSPDLSHGARRRHHHGTLAAFALSTETELLSALVLGFGSEQ